MAVSFPSLPTPSRGAHLRDCLKLAGCPPGCRPVAHTCASSIRQLPLHQITPVFTAPARGASPGDFSRARGAWLLARAALRDLVGQPQASQGRCPLPPDLGHSQGTSVLGGAGLTGHGHGHGPLTCTSAPTASFQASREDTFPTLAHAPVLSHSWPFLPLPPWPQGSSDCRWLLSWAPWHAHWCPSGGWGVLLTLSQYRVKVFTLFPLCLLL